MPWLNALITLLEGAAQIIGVALNTLNAINTMKFA